VAGGGDNQFQFKKRKSAKPGVHTIKPFWKHRQDKNMGLRPVAKKEKKQDGAKR